MDLLLQYRGGLLGVDSTCVLSSAILLSRTLLSLTYIFISSATIVYTSQFASGRTRINASSGNRPNHQRHYSLMANMRPLKFRRRSQTQLSWRPKFQVVLTPKATSITKGSDENASRRSLAPRSETAQVCYRNLEQNPHLFQR